MAGGLRSTRTGSLHLILDSEIHRHTAAVDQETATTEDSILPEADPLAAAASSSTAGGGKLAGPALILLQQHR